VSRLKNQIPAFPSIVEYVRTLISGNDETTGAGGRPRRRKPVIRNGVTPSHALPSNVSIGICSGTIARRESWSTRQCAKSR
jgi:hypothetical protein